MKWKLGLAVVLGAAVVIAILLVPRGSVREVATLDCGGHFARDLAFTPDGGLLNPNHYLAVAIDYLYTRRPNWPASTAVGTCGSAAMKRSRQARRVSA